jgi:hypothetical protein
VFIVATSILVWYRPSVRFPACIVFQIVPLFM